MNNLLIVESEGDKFFIEALLSDINLKLEIGQPICSINKYECIGGIDKLEQKLKFVKIRIQKEAIGKIGIIFDADTVGIEQREEEIKDKINSVFGEDDNDLFSIYILNKNGFGELEDILKEIKTSNSPYADCLDSWKECLSTQEIDISDKIFNKFWINNYIIYDTCITSKHRRQKSKYCIFEYAMKEKDIWNFAHPILNDLKGFLQKLGEQQ